MALTALARENAPEEDGVREILAAAPPSWKVRWDYTVHDRRLGDAWIFYADTDDLKVVLLKGAPPEGFKECHRADREAIQRPGKMAKQE